ncbi:MAG: hypothetical protein HYR60_13650 [Acidobacteria bacterium]|nr:hypothetical protein [Acidobacteriota bacterium]
MRSKRLVVDASVAVAAGTTEHPISKACREVLEEVRRHRIVMSTQIRYEWMKRRSVIAVEWLEAMQRRGKVVDLGGLEPHPKLRAEIAGNLGSSALC